MKGSFARILDALSASRSTKESVWTTLSRVDPWIFAHHPPHSCFHEHVWTWKGMHFCKGCVVTLVGAFAGAISLICTGWLHYLTTAQLAGVFLVLLLPSILTSLFDAGRRIKHCSRFALGILITASVWELFVADSWLIRAAIVCSYLTVKIPLDRRRRNGNQLMLKSNQSLKPHIKARTGSRKV